MKKMHAIIARLYMVMVICAGALISFAQDSSVSINTTAESSETSTSQSWYVQPWAWVLGGLVVLLLLIAIMRSGSKRTNVTTTNTDYTSRPDA